MTGGFYLPQIHGDNIPSDAVEITAAEHAVLLAGQSAGQLIVAGTSGAPMLMPPQPMSLIDLRAAALARVDALRALFFTKIGCLQSEALARGNTVDAMAIANLQQGARDITKIDLTGATTAAQLDAKFLLAWKALLATASPSVVLAFQRLTQ